MYTCRICANEFEKSLEACPYCGCPPGFPLPPEPLADKERYCPVYVKNLRSYPPVWIYWDSLEEKKVFIRRIPMGKKGEDLVKRLEQIREADLPIFPVISEIKMSTEEDEGYYAYAVPDGNTLSEYLERERPLELAYAIRVEEGLLKVYEWLNSVNIRHGSLEPSGIYLDGDVIVLDYFDADAAEADDSFRIRQILDCLREGGCLQTGELQADRSVTGRIRTLIQSLKG